MRFIDEHAHHAGLLALEARPADLRHTDLRLEDPPSGLEGLLRPLGGDERQACGVRGGAEGAREAAEAVRRARKLERKRLEREGF